MSVLHATLCWVLGEVERLNGQAGLCRLAETLRCSVAELRRAKDSGEVEVLGAWRCSVLCGLADVAGMSTVEVDGIVWDVQEVWSSDDTG